MNIMELLQPIQFLVDADGGKKSVVFDCVQWEGILTLLEDIEDSNEIYHLRNAGEEIVPWRQAKSELRSEGINV
ncbi:MAG: hypothetical protein ABH886_05445 [Candidatus Desantisbacteria bacterium]